MTARSMWQTPVFEEIKMDAEISSYQEDQDPARDPQFCERDAPANVEK